MIPLPHAYVNKLPLGRDAPDGNRRYRHPGAFRATQLDDEGGDERAADPLTPHTAAMLLLRRPEGCRDAERAAMAQLRACYPDIATTMAFTSGSQPSCAIREVGQFALKIRQDEAAVRAGYMLSWSNDQTEGQGDPTEAVETADVWASEVRSVTATCSHRMTDRFTKSSGEPARARYV